VVKSTLGSEFRVVFIEGHNLDLVVILLNKTAQGQSAQKKINVNISQSIWIENTYLNRLSGLTDQFMLYRDQGASYL
jgi:hypothetical protein